jgi:hypothetical protein|tara:strand:+ start:257 stop:2041 length:1785 start_codon:yes stop_codon:yes gene_type:complete
MSYEVANEIVNMYMQSNTRRINSAMETAYQEALSTYQSDVEARKAALDVLKLEQRSYDDYLKMLARNMKDLRSGNINIAKKRAEVLEYNRREKLRVEQKNRLERHKTGETNAMRRYRDDIARAQAQASSQQERNRLEQAKNEATRKMARLDMDARQHANKVVLSGNVLPQGISTDINKLQSVFQDIGQAGNTFEADFNTALQGTSFFSNVQKAKDDVKDLSEAEGLIGDDDPEFKYAREDYKLAGVRRKIKESIMDMFETYTPEDQKEQNRERVNSIIDDLLNNPQPKNLQQSGMFAEVIDISDADVDRRYDKERQLYIDTEAPKLNKILKKQFRLNIQPPPMKKPFVYKPILKTVPGEGATEEQYIDELRKQAEPVFNELRADDDTPFQLTEDEIATVGEAAVNAYKELQIERTQTPLISLEERRLLDPLALERQLNIMRQGQRVRSIQPKLDSFEQVRSRAGEILESPKKRSTENAGTPLEQRFYATQRQSARLSYESDEDLRSKGKPEELGVSLYKETFDPLNSTFRQNNTYQSVVDRIQQGFGSPEEQMRAISAFDSRVMAQQRTKAPIIMKDGSQNREYLEALKALGKK